MNTADVHPVRQCGPFLFPTQNPYIHLLKTLHHPRNLKMKRYLLISVLLTACTTSFAQSPRQLHEMGKRVEGLALIRQQIQTFPADSLPNAYFQQADLYFGMYRLEKFLLSTDSALQSAGARPAPAIQLRYYLNKARYYNYHTITYKARPYIDSAASLVNRYGTDSDQLDFFTARISYHRNADRSKLFQLLDSAKQFLSIKNRSSLFEGYMLWRTIANTYMDLARPDPIPGKPNYKMALAAFNEAEKILISHFPQNKVDLVNVFNLKGLLFYYDKQYPISKSYFNASEKLLSTHNITIKDYTSIHLITLLWQLQTNKALYSGPEAIQVKNKQLNRWMDLTHHWAKWEEENKLSDLNYFRDVYASNPYALIVSQCDDLYQATKDTSYLQKAFWAQEMLKGKAFLKKMQEKTGRSFFPNLSIPVIQASLKPDEAIISFSDVHSNLYRLYAVIITRDKTSMVNINVNQFLYPDMPTPYIDTVCRSLPFFKQLYHHYYKVVFKPIEKELPANIRKLTIYSSGYSSRYNLPLLLPDTTGAVFSSLNYLQNKYDFRFNFCYTLDALSDINRSGKPSTAPTFTAFVPDYTNTELHALPFFQQQASYLKDQLGGRIFQNGTASLEQFNRYAPEADILHIAGHGTAQNYFTGDGKIFLDGSPKDLEVSAISKQNLKARLTVLSLCESGLGERLNTETDLNLAYWFAYAGSESCLFSYWRLDDRAASIIINEFYRLLAEGLPKSTALRKAKEFYLQNARSEEEKNPIYWSGLTLIGDDSPIEMPKNKNYLSWLLLPAGLTVLVLAGRRRFITKASDR